MKIKESIMKYDGTPELPRALLDELEVGIKDVAAGKLIPHKESMRQIREELGVGKV